MTSTTTMAMTETYRRRNGETRGTGSTYAGITTPSDPESVDPRPRLDAYPSDNEYTVAGRK